MAPSEWHPPNGTLQLAGARAHRVVVAFFAWISESAPAGPRGEARRGMPVVRAPTQTELVAAVASADLEVSSDRVAKRDGAVAASALIEVCSDRVAKRDVAVVAWRVIARSVCSHLPSILPGAFADASSGERGRCARRPCSTASRDRAHGPPPLRHGSDWHPPTGTLRLAPSDWRAQTRASKRTPVSFSLSSQRRRCASRSCEALVELTFTG
jgi:hypothetical protein